ncbi:MAG: trypsin-like peptidase domain-containing protein [Burkholderiales bacterium]|nr:trypsin-like peptidase domain-containing protein [Burkholderiales bacterium]
MIARKMRGLSALAVLAATLGVAAPALAQAPPQGASFSEAAAAFRALGVARRHDVQMLMVAAGYWPAVSNETFSRRLFGAILRFQQEQGFPLTGQLDAVQWARLHALADPLLRLWRLQPVRHPITDATLWVPNGLGLSTKVTAGGLQFDNPPHQTLRIYFHHLRGATLAGTMRDVVARRDEHGLAIDYKVLRDDFFAVKASKPGVENYIRYHVAPDGLVGFSVFWNSEHREIEAGRLVTLMSDLFRAARLGDMRAPPAPLGLLPPLDPPPTPPETEFPVGTLPPPFPSVARVDPVIPPPVEGRPAVSAGIDGPTGAGPVLAAPGADVAPFLPPPEGGLAGAPSGGEIAPPPEAPSSRSLPSSAAAGVPADRTPVVVAGATPVPELPAGLSIGTAAMPQHHATPPSVRGVRPGGLPEGMVPRSLKPLPARVRMAALPPGQRSVIDELPPALQPRPERSRASPPGRPETTEPEARRQSGSGFFVSAEGHILTNAHVVSGCVTAIAFTVEGETASLPFPVTILARNGRDDLALLKADRRHVTGVGRLRPDVRQGESVAAYGFPLAGLLSRTGNFTTGTVTATRGLGDDDRLLQVSVPVQAGNSGGPLLDAQGAVVGLVVGKLNAGKVAAATGDLPQNVNFAIKAGVARAMLPEASGKIATGMAAQPLKPEDLARQAQAITVGVACDASANGSELSAKRQ